MHEAATLKHTPTTTDPLTPLSAPIVTSKFVLVVAPAVKVTVFHNDEKSPPAAKICGEFPESASFCFVKAAPSCRKISNAARTTSGTTSLSAVAASEDFCAASEAWVTLRAMLSRLRRRPALRSAVACVVAESLKLAAAEKEAAEDEAAFALRYATASARETSPMPKSRAEDRGSEVRTTLLRSPAFSNGSGQRGLECRRSWSCPRSEGVEGLDALEALELWK
mmetsp:Transcript_11326/g.22073  ORF Transcript_11326/g.22073 Transcript_11326/m.22073 type:complete len:223 (-) Transcript_11326:168-836(-)